MSRANRVLQEQVHHVVPAALLHDLRTPLSQILGYSELLIEQMSDKGEKEFIPHLEKIRAAGNQMLEMLEENFSAPCTHEGNAQ
jgi:signal transduction histidine kinase